MRLIERFRSTSSRLGGDTAAQLVLAGIVGIAVGAAAALLITTIDLVGSAFDSTSDALGGSRWVLLAIVPSGFLLAHFVARWGGKQTEGDGVPEAVAALTVRGGYLGRRVAPGKLAATALTLGSGGSAGREGPIVLIGAAVGSFIARRFGLGEARVRSLVAAGAGAAIGASFNAPIAGMLFAMEVILGSFAVRHMSAVVVASVAAAVTSRSLVGEELSLSAGIYHLGDARELILYAGLALIVVGLAFLFLRALDGAERIGSRIGGPAWTRPLVAGLVIAGIGLVEPRILGTGQEFAGDLLIGHDTGFAWWVLGAFAVGKIIATSVTLGGRTSGGAFMPALFVGAAAGAGFAELVAPAWGFSLIRPGAFAVVGMAAMFAAMARAPLTAMLIVFEITGARDYGLVLPLMLAAALATALTERLHPESMYSMALARWGIRPVRSSEVDVLDTVQVGGVMSRNPSFATPSMTMEEVQSMMDEHRLHGLAVVDESGSLAGIISITDILRAGGRKAEVSVRDAMTPRPVTVTPDVPVSVALERMAALGVGRLPVVDPARPQLLVGMFRREDAVRAYHKALSASTAQELDRQRLRVRTDPGADFFEFRIPVGSVADGRPIKEVSWPEGATLVSVRRGRQVLVPTGHTRLEAGDIAVAFATPAAHRSLIERLNATGEESTAEVVITQLADRSTRGKTDPDQR